jgi:hypothetical protein
VHVQLRVPAQGVHELWLLDGHGLRGYVDELEPGAQGDGETGHLFGRTDPGCAARSCDFDEAVRRTREV